MNKTVYRNFYLTLLFALLLMLDRISKTLATSYLKNGNPFVIIKNVFEFSYLDGGNSGAAWGILQGKMLFFITITLIVIAIIFLILKRLNNIIETIFTHEHTQLYKSLYKYIGLQVIFVFLSAGAVGNLIDRVVNGYVIDFIYFKLINFPIFNVADCYVTVSVILLIIMSIFKLSEKEFDLIFSFKPITKCLETMLVEEDSENYAKEDDNE